MNKEALIENSGYQNTCVYIYAIVNFGVQKAKRQNFIKC